MLVQVTLTYMQEKQQLQMLIHMVLRVLVMVHTQHYQKEVMLSQLMQILVQLEKHLTVQEVLITMRQLVYLVLLMQIGLTQQ